MHEDTYVRRTYVHTYVPTRTPRGRGSIQSWLSGLESVARCAYEPRSAARSIRACILHACIPRTTSVVQICPKNLLYRRPKNLDRFRPSRGEIFAGCMQGRRVDIFLKKKKYLFKRLSLFISFQRLQFDRWIFFFYFFFLQNLVRLSRYISPKCQVFFRPCLPSSALG